MINKLAQYSRVHRLRRPCEKFLTEVHQMSNVSIPDLVTKAIEQVRFDYVFNPEDSRCMCRYFFSLIHKDFITLSAQLDLINTTNMSFFDRPQQASILTLKATIQIRLGLFDEADKVCPRAECIITVSSL